MRVSRPLLSLSLSLLLSLSLSRNQAVMDACGDDRQHVKCASVCWHTDGAAGGGQAAASTSIKLPITDDCQTTFAALCGRAHAEGCRERKGNTGNTGNTPCQCLSGHSSLACSCSP
jgi:hypothetical protein